MGRTDFLAESGGRTGTPPRTELPPVGADEAERLAALRRYAVLDTPEESAFDDLTMLAAEVCEVPIALVGLMDTDRLWFKSRVGLEAPSAPREVAFCTYAMTRPELLLVPDATQDPRFADNPMVTGASHTRFYAGVPLVDADGYTLGTLCVLDVVPRQLTERQLALLAAIGRQVLGQLSLRRKAIDLADSVTTLAEQRRLLAESEQRWRALVEHSPVAVAVIDAEARFAYANPCAVELYGADEGASIIGRLASELVPKGALRSTAELFARVTAGECVLGTRWVLRRLDGRVVQVEVNAVAVDYGGRRAVQVELRDMTAQVEAERVVRESERRWRAVFDGSPVGIGLTDDCGRIVAANAALCTFLGRSEEDVLGRRGIDFTHADDVKAHRDVSALIAAAPDGIARIEKRYLRPDGEVRWAWLTMTHTLGPSGETWTLGHIQDVTVRRIAEEAIRQSEANLTAVAKVAQRIQTGGEAGQTIVDAGLQLAEANYVSLMQPHSAKVLRVTASTNPRLVDVEVDVDSVSATAEVFRTGEAHFLADPAEDQGVRPALLQLTGARSIYIVPVRSLDSVVGVLVVGWKHRVPDLDDRRAGVVTMLADQAGAALGQAKLIAELESRATTDPLTNLPNRRGWDDLISRSMGVAGRTGQPLTVAIADLDHFKRFNDTYGHPAGDELLRQVGRALRSALRDDDVAARWGGEEFAIALTQCPPSDAVRVLARVREGCPGRETFSVGFVTWDGRESAAQLMERADRALYAAKTSGRDRMVGA